MISLASGLLKGLNLKSPQGSQTRPSSERLRQGTFNVLRHYRWDGFDHIVDQAVVADLFSGSGAWGLEALSNGAAHVIFVEAHPLALKCLRTNVTHAQSCLLNQHLPGDPPRLQISALKVEAA